MANWIIRQVNGDDLHFIYSTWARSYRYDSPLGKSCKNSIFFPEYNKIIDAILGHEDTSTLLAVKPDDPTIIFGYLVFQPGIAHYAFTKEAFQRQGIAKALFEYAGSPQLYTHKTFSVRPILEKHSQLTFNPFVIFNKGDAHGSED